MRTRTRRRTKRGAHSLQVNKTCSKDRSRHTKSCTANRTLIGVAGPLGTALGQHAFDIPVRRRLPGNKKNPSDTNGGFFVLGPSVAAVRGRWGQCKGRRGGERNRVLGGRRERNGGRQVARAGGKEGTDKGFGSARKGTTGVEGWNKEIREQRRTKKRYKYMETRDIKYETRQGSENGVFFLFLAARQPAMTPSEAWKRRHILTFPTQATPDLPTE